MVIIYLETNAFSIKNEYSNCNMQKSIYNWYNLLPCVVFTVYKKITRLVIIFIIKADFLILT